MKAVLIRTVLDTFTEHLQCCTAWMASSMKSYIIDHSDLQVLHQNRKLLTGEQEALLDIVREREKRSVYMQRQRQRRDETLIEQGHEHVDWTYAARSGIVLMSSSSRAKPFIFCGHGNRVNRRGFCHIYRYCPPCNWIHKAEPTIKEFACDESFYKATWTFITVSFTTNQDRLGWDYMPDARDHFDPLDANCVYEILGKYDPCPIPLNDNPGVHEEDYIACWDAGHVAVKALKMDRQIQGYLGNDDLAIRFNVPVTDVFCECAGLPHTHYIVTTAPGELLNNRTMEDIHDLATEFLRQVSPELELFVSVRGFGVHDAETLSRLIRYVMKPLDFVTPYGMALRCAEASFPDGTLKPEFMESLNLGVDYLFDAFEDGLFYRRRGVRRAGNLLCDSRTDYIGTRAVPRHRKQGTRAKFKAQLKKAQQRIIDDRDHEF